MTILRHGLPGTGAVCRNIWKSGLPARDCATRRRVSWRGTLSRREPNIIRTRAARPRPFPGRRRHDPRGRRRSASRPATAARARVYAVRTRVVPELWLRAFDAASIPFFSSRARLLRRWSDQPLLRPMRDVDILLRKRDLQAAQAVLQRGGFTPSSGIAVARDYHHLAGDVDDGRRGDGDDRAASRAAADHAALETDVLRRCAGPCSVIPVGRHGVPHPRPARTCSWHLYAHAFAHQRPASGHSPDLGSPIPFTPARNGSTSWTGIVCAVSADVSSARCPLLHHLTPLS